MPLPQDNLSIDHQFKEIEKIVTYSDDSGISQKIKVLESEYANNYYYYFKAGLVYIQIREYEEAIKCLHTCLALSPGFSKAILSLGSTYFCLQRLDQALFFLELKSDQIQLATIFRYIGNIFHERKEYVYAEKYYRKGYRIDPRFTELIIDLAQLLLGKIVYLKTVEKSWIEEAFLLIDEAISHKDDQLSGRAYKVKADLCKMTDHLDEAVTLYEIAFKYGNSDESVVTNLMTVNLAKGDFKEGMKNVDLRWKLKDQPYDDRAFIDQYDFPDWEGEKEVGKTVLVKAEQGIGDQILMFQLIKKIFDYGMRVVFFGEARIAPLFKRALPKLVITCEEDREVHKKIMSADYQTYIIELIKIFKIDPSLQQPCLPYLFSQKRRKQTIIEKYNDKFGGKLKIGISWVSKGVVYGERKTAPLELWKPILTVKGVQFISVQYGNVQNDLSYIHRCMPVHIYQDEEIDPIHDLESAAAQFDALDLVISVSNTGAHLAAALGKPVWLLLSCAPLWHWLHNRTDSIWYKDVTIYRQQHLYDWESVLQKVADDLQQFVNNKNSNALTDS